MSEAGAALRPFGISLRRSLGGSEQTMFDQPIVRTTGKPWNQFHVLLGAPDWDVTTASLIPETNAFVAEHRPREHLIHHGKATSYDLAHYAAGAISFVTVDAPYYGWQTSTKNVKWLSLSKENLVTDLSDYPIRSFTLFDIDELALTRIGEITWANADPEVADLVLYLSTSSKLPYARSLADRVQELEQDLLDEEGEEAISPVSLITLIRLLETTRTLREPGIAVGRAGQLAAKWTGPEGREIIIHFGANGETQFYAFVPDQARPEKIEVLSASPSAEALPTRLTQLELLSWMM